MSGVRARAYRLLADLYLAGVTNEALGVVRAVPDLAAALPGPVDMDAMAAEHHRLLGMEVFPYASVFLDPDGRIGGHATDEAGRAFARAGLDLRLGSEPPDHLGHELALMAVLVERGAAAPRERASFLRGHVLRWVPVFVHSALRVADPFWTLVLELTMDLVVEDAASAAADTASVEEDASAEEDAAAPTADAAASTPDAVAADAAAPTPDAVAPTAPGAAAAPPSSPARPELLEDPHTGLREVAAYLATPARSGLYLGLEDLRRLGRSARLPGGFGGRARVLENLLRSASTYDALPGLLDALDRLCADQEGFLRRLLESLPSAPAAPWLERLAATRALVERIRVQEPVTGE